MIEPIEMRNKANQEAYNKIFSKCPDDKKELLNFMMIELQESGVLITDKIKKYIPELVTSL